MVAHGTLVGPFPPGADPDEYDRLRRRVLWSLPTGLYLLGSVAGEERNLMTINLVTQVCIEQKLLGVAVDTSARTHRLVSEGGCFSLCLLDRADPATARKFVKPAADDRAAMTLNGLAYRDAPVSGAPLLVAAPAWLDCRVVEALALGSHTLFVGEVVDAGFAPGAEQSAEGSPEVLRMEDTRMNYGG